MASARKPKEQTWVCAICGMPEYQQCKHLKADSNSPLIKIADWKSVQRSMEHASVNPSAIPLRVKEKPNDFTIA
jgi:hypothetical protein